jgi:hypothetical protein
MSELRHLRMREPQTDCRYDLVDQDERTSISMVSSGSSDSARASSRADRVTTRSAFFIEQILQPVSCQPQFPYRIFPVRLQMRWTSTPRAGRRQ